MPAIDKLVEISSAPLLPFPDDTAWLSRLGDLGAQLEDLLRRRNGFYAFESALHVFPIGQTNGVIDLATWNDPATWRHAYQGLMDDCLFFAEDAFGFPFGIEGSDVVSCDPETGRRRPMASSIEEWAQKILIDWRELTGHPVAHRWQAKNSPLKAGLRLAPPHLFMLGDGYDDLRAKDQVELMRFRGWMSAQLKDLPDDTRVRMVVT